MDFCQSQHSKGLVTFDTEEKYLDVKRIVGPDGENNAAFTALYNPTGTRCSLESHDSLPTCSSLLVRIFYSVIVVSLLSLGRRLHFNFPF